MNPHDDTFHIDAPANHSRLADAPQQHNASRPFEGATDLELVTSHLHTLQDLLNEALQAGFTESPQLRNLDDVSTWNTDRIRDVTMYIESRGLAILNPQDDSKNDGDDDDDEAVGACGGVNLEHHDRHVEPAGADHAPPPSGGAGSTRRRLRVYEYVWPPHSDPDVDGRRRRRACIQHALRQKLQRDFH